MGLGLVSWDISEHNCNPDLILIIDSLKKSLNMLARSMRFV